MRRLFVVLAAVTALALPAGAAATIVPQKGLGGVSLDASQAQVRAALGKPTRVQRGTNDFGPFTILHFRGYRAVFQGNASLTQIETTLAREKTKSGIGVGSTRAQVKAALKGEKCEGPAAAGHCFLGQFLPGKTVTSFLFKNGRVIEVIIGYIID